MAPARLRSNHVFINCPFDAAYKPIFDAIVFAVDNLGFVARCALEVDDSGEVRLSKIERIIEECKFGIHDISAVSVDPATRLPRFNMPLELGLFLGCKRYGADNHGKKVSLILDTEPYRYRTFISDIAGQDIHAHGGRPEQAIVEVRNWLTSVSRRRRMPGGADIVERHNRFQAELPRICTQLRRDPATLTFNDLAEAIALWIKAYRS